MVTTVKPKINIQLSKGFWFNNSKDEKKTKLREFYTED